MPKNRVCANTPALSRRAFVGGTAAIPFTSHPLFAAPFQKTSSTPKYQSDNDTLIHARIAEICCWIDAPFPELNLEDGGITASDTFLDWHRDHSISLDLTCGGDIKGTVIAHHRFMKCLYELVAKDRV